MNRNRFEKWRNGQQRNGRAPIPAGKVFDLGKKPDMPDAAIVNLTAARRLKDAVEFSLKEVREVLDKVELTADEADALKTYDRVVSEGFEGIKQLHTVALLQALRPSAERFQEGMNNLRTALGVEFTKDDPVKCSECGAPGVTSSVGIHEPGHESGCSRFTREAPE